MTSLPIETLRPEFEAAWARGPVVVTASTGTGKSTCVPVWCAEAGRVLVVEPRRVACRSLARFVAQQRGCAVGGWVGYAHRHEERLGKDTRIAYVTPGVALRLLAEGEVARFDVIIVDEFHERTVENDLVLALALDRAEHRLVVMSATLDGEEVARYIGGEWLQAAGEMYPVTVEYDPPISRGGTRSLLPTGRDLDRRVAAALDRVEDRPGDVLVFLPGKGEIQACYNLLQNRRAWEVLRLHGELPPEEQDRAFTPGARRRVILATNVAETSVTLPNIGVVIDSGLVRQKQYREGREVLALGPIAWDSAEQRRGRAGRVRPGHCLRLWDPEARLEERTLPEIHRSSLAHFVLMVASCGRRVGELRFLDAPRDYAVRAAEEELQRLGALDEHWQITPRGRRLARLPLDPFHGALLLAAEEVGGLQEMVDLVASLAQGRPLFRALGSPSDREAVWQARAPLRAAQCDGVARILALRRGDPESQALHREAWEEGRRIAQQLRELLHLPPCRATEFDRSPLLRAILKADPTTAFVPRRRRRGAWGNGQQEVTLSSDSFARPDAPALLVLETHSVQQKGSRPTHFATCALPCPLEMLVQAGVGRVELGALKWDGQTLTGMVRIVHGGRELLEEEQELEGPLAVEGIVRLALEGRLLQQEMAELREEIELWNLKQQLEGEGRAPTVELQDWLRERLTALGVQRGSDLALLLPEDLRFPGVTEEERRDLNRRFPRHLSLGGLIADVEYDVPRRTVTLVKREGSAQDRPSSQFLPSWPGWRVLFRDHQRVTVLRE